jgi:hypothetical protein
VPVSLYFLLPLVALCFLPFVTDMFTLLTSIGSMKATLGAFISVVILCTSGALSLSSSLSFTPISPLWDEL